MENPDDLNLSKSLSNDNKNVNAQFYRAYCETEKKWLGNWDADKKVAENSKDNHERDNSDHTVTIETK